MSCYFSPCVTHCVVCLYICIWDDDIKSDSLNITSPPPPRRITLKTYRTFEGKNTPLTQCEREREKKKLSKISSSRRHSIQIWYKTVSIYIYLQIEEQHVTQLQNAMCGKIYKVRELNSIELNTQKLNRTQTHTHTHTHTHTQTHRLLLGDDDYYYTMWHCTFSACKVQPGAFYLAS